MNTQHLFSFKELPDSPQIKQWLLWLKTWELMNGVTLGENPQHPKSELPKLPDHTDYELQEDRILVLPFESENVSKGGIIIPPTAREKLHRGLVVLTGPGSPDTPMVYKRGDVVDYGKYEGVEYNFKGTELLLIRQTGVFGKWKKLP
jgi:chaperonin GroES